MTMEKPNFDNMQIESDSILWFGKTANEVEQEEGCKEMNMLTYQDVKDAVKNFQQEEEPKKAKVITLAVTEKMFLQLERAAEYFECSKQEFIRDMLPGCLQDFKEVGDE